MSHHSIRPWAGALPALVVFLVIQHASPLTAAQQPLLGDETRPLLQGVVVHELTGQAIQATVTLVGTDIETRTGRYGQFAFSDVQPGLVSVRVTSPDHPGVIQQVEVKADAIVFIRFVLPSVTAILDELLVGVPRNRLGIEQPQTAADLVANKVPRFLRTNSGIVGRDDGVINLRGTTSFSSGVQPHVYVDGARVSGGETALEVLTQIPAEQVLDVQVLRGPVAAFLYPLAANGVVLVTTR